MVMFVVARSAGDRNEGRCLIGPDLILAYPIAVIVMEDDVSLASDAFRYFDFAASLVHSTRAGPLPQASKIVR